MFANRMLVAAYLAVIFILVQAIIFSQGNTRKLFIYTAVTLVIWGLPCSWGKIERCCRRNKRLAYKYALTVFLLVLIALVLIEWGWPAYLFWAWVQWVLIYKIFFLRCRQIVPTGQAQLITAALFSLAHLPNTPLMLLTSLLGYFGILIARRSKSLAAVSIIHAALGTGVGFYTPVSLRIGYGYIEQKYAIEQARTQPQNHKRYR